MAFFLLSFHARFFLQLWRKTTSLAMDDEQYSHLRRASRAILPQLNAEIESDSLVTFEGIYVYRYCCGKNCNNVVSM